MRCPMLRITTIRLSLSQLKMHRLAARAFRLITTYAGVDATFAALAVMLIPACERYLAAFDNRPTTGQNKKVEDGEQAVDQLRSAVSRWLTLLAINAPDLIGNYTNSRVPDDVFANAKRLVVDLAAPRSGTDAPLPYAEPAIEELNGLIPVAKTAWAEARAERALIQERKQELRAAARALQPMLVAFRQLLLNIVGRRHVDYQTLRPSRVLETTDESDPVESDNAPDESQPEEPGAELDSDDSRVDDAPESDDSRVDDAPSDVDASSDVDESTDANGA